MNEAITTKIVLGQVSDSIYDLADRQKVDMDRVRNAVNSALGEMQHNPKYDKNDAKMAWKAGTKKAAETFTLSEKQAAKFITAGGNNGLRFFLFNQEVLRLEQTLGTFDLADWPSYLGEWMNKFKTKVAVPVTAP